MNKIVNMKLVMNKYLLISGTIFGGLSVILGAFAAHGLEKLISAEEIETFQTGVRYQMYHAILLLFTGSTNLITEKSKKTIFWLIVFGILYVSIKTSKDVLDTFGIIEDKFEDSNAQIQQDTDSLQKLIKFSDFCCNE